MYLHTARIPWYSLREAVTADDTAITDFKHSNMPAVGANRETGQNGTIDLWTPELKEANALMFASWGAGGDDKVITGYKLYGIMRSNGPIIELLSGAMISGSQACTVHPLTGATLTSNLWVDSITVTGGLLDGQHDILDFGNNKICMVVFDKKGIDRVFMEYDEAAGGMTAWNCMLTGH